jgi:hypothetical protein
MLGRVYRQLDILAPNTNSFYSQRDTWGIGLELKCDLFDDFVRENRVREAKALL